MTEIRNSQLSIKLVKGDITGLEVDAIVSSGNSRLWMGGGVAGAIKQAGGREIEHAAITRGPLPVGEAVATGGGALKARYVIHAAVTGMDFTASQQSVRQSVHSVIQRVRELDIRSVAFPALGAGMGRLPPGECAEAILGEITARARQAPRLREVTLVVNDEAVYRAFDRGLRGLAPR